MCANLIVHTCRSVTVSKSWRMISFVTLLIQVYEQFLGLLNFRIPFLVSPPTLGRILVSVLALLSLPAARVVPVDVKSAILLLSGPF